MYNAKDKMMDNLMNSSVSSVSSGLSNGLSAQTIERNAELESLGESLGEWKAYDSQLPIAEIAGTRIVKALYQVAKTGANKGKKAGNNSYVRIPTKHLNEEGIVSGVVELSPYILGWLQSVEDTVLKAQHKEGRLNVFCDSLSLESLMEYLEETSESGRLNKERINEWFTEELADTLTLKFAAKLGVADINDATEAQLVKIQAVIMSYKLKFASLAGGKTFIKDEDCTAMITVINSCDDASETLLGKRFITKLEKMMIKEESLLELL